MTQGFFEENDKQQVSAFFESVYQDLIDGKNADKSNKKAFFLYGFAGAGKSSYAKMLQAKNPNLVWISTDELIAKSPDYQPRPIKLNDTHKGLLTQDLKDFVHFCGEHIFKRSQQDGHSVIIDGLSGGSLRSRTMDFKRTGYDVENINIVIPKRLNDLNIISRYISAQEKGFYAPFMANMKKTSKDIEYTADDIDMCSFLGTRLKLINPITNNILYDSKTNSSDKLPGDIFVEEFSRPLNEKEKIEVQVREKYLKSKIEKLNHTPTQKRFYNYAVASCLCTAYHFKNSR